jgi:hypothetical protein
MSTIQLTNLEIKELQSYCKDRIVVLEQLFSTNERSLTGKQRETKLEEIKTKIATTQRILAILEG